MAVAVKQRGFAVPSLLQVLVVLGLVSAAAATIWGAIAWHADTHFKRGEASVKVQWEQANREAEEDAEMVRIEVETEIAKQMAARAAAELVARQANSRWEAVRRDAQRRGEVLAVCEARVAQPDRAVVDARAAGDRPAPAAVADAGADRGAPRALLTWRFVHLYDTAWTSGAGEPIPGAPEGRAGAAGSGTASPYGLDDVLAIHGENARRCSEDRRELGELIAKIRAAAEAFDRGNSK